MYWKNVVSIEQDVNNHQTSSKGEVKDRREVITPTKLTKGHTLLIITIIIISISSNKTIEPAISLFGASCLNRYAFEPKIRMRC